MRRFFLVAIALQVAICTLAQDSTVRKLDGLVSAYAQLGRFNGTVLVSRQGNILLQKGYGVKNAADNSMNDIDTRGQIASVTKSFTAAMVLRLVEMKRMKLTDKLSRYYRGFPYGDSITIENLLSHTSGLHNFTEQDTSIRETDERRMVAYLKTLQPDFAPGTNWHYSNSGYVMLGYIIQKVSGMSYWQAVRKYIFQPLQMKDSGFDFAHMSGNKAIGYDVLNDAVKEPAAVTDSTVPFSAGAIYSTVKDLYRWHAGLQSYKVVDSSLMNKAYRPSTLHNYGYGWQTDSIYGKKMVSHSGSITGFGSNFARIPEDDICIAVLSNRGGSTFDVQHITDRLLAILYQQPYSIPVKRVPVTLNENILKRYTGTYEIAEIHLTVEMSINNDLLIAQPSKDGHRGPTSIMLPMNDTQFYDRRDEEIEINFDIDTNGKVRGVTILQKGMRRYAMKIK